MDLQWGLAADTGIPAVIGEIKVPKGSAGHVCPWSYSVPTVNAWAANDTSAYGQWCTPWGNPGDGGQRNFDNIASAWLTVFQSVTLTDWSYIMYDCQVDGRIMVHCLHRFWYDR
jgi:hypothetical protein